jgi:hypothetical protein
MKLVPVANVAAALLLGGCLSPVDITTAYESEVYLCDDDAGYAARVADCVARREAGGDCSGVISFEGTIDGVEVVVDTDLSEVTTTSLRFPDLSLARDNIDLYGDSPYFSFRLSIASLGDADSRPDGEVVQAFGRSPDCEDGTLDDVVRFSMRVIAAGGSTDDDLTTGALTMLRQTTNEHIGTFDGAYRDGSPLRGCFTVFTDTAAIEQAEVCD